MKKLIKISADAICDVGAVRKNNEDMVAVDSLIFRNDAYQLELTFEQHDSSFLLAVSDGIGGANAGEVASEFLLNELIAGKTGIPEENTETALKQYFSRIVETIHNSLNEDGRRNSERDGMGATLAAVLARNNRLFYFSAGDSRVYRFRRGILKQISADHSLAAITGGGRSSSHVILNAVGGGPNVFIDFKDITDKIMDGDYLLLCSDGLSDMLDDPAIEALLDSGANAAALCGAAKKAAGKDNISVILAKVFIEGEDEPAEDD